MGNVEANAAELTAGLEGAEGYVAEVEKQTKPVQDQAEREAEEQARLRHEAMGGAKEGPRMLGVQPSRVVMYVPGQGVRPFPFARVFNGKHSQHDVYDLCARPVVTSCLNGFNACLFCYGQTGSGKTHSAFGPEGVLEGAVGVSDSSGIVIRALDEVGSCWGHPCLLSPPLTPLCVCRSCVLRLS